jgi:hypothetical protein
MPARPLRPTGQHCAEKSRRPARSDTVKISTIRRFRLPKNRHTNSILLFYIDIFIGTKLANSNLKR